MSVGRLWMALALWSACTCATSHADEIKLANGDTLNGEVVEWAVDYVVVDHPQLGRITLTLDQLEIDTVERPNAGLFGTRILEGWKRSINFGLSGKQGNSESTNLTFGADFSYRDAFERWRLDSRYLFNRDEDGVSDNNSFTNLRRDWLFPESRWFAFASGRHQYDEFEAWEHRVVLIVGPGFHVVQREKYTLDVTLAPAYTREFGDRDNNQFDAMFGIEFDWKPWKRLSLRLQNQFFARVSPDAGEWRNLTIADLRIALLEKPSLSFNVGGRNEYETDAAPGDQNHNLNYYMTLGLDF